MANDRKDVIKGFRKEIRDLQKIDDAESLYERIEGAEEINKADEKKLGQELQIKVNELKQAEHDRLADEGKNAEASKVITRKKAKNERPLKPADEAGAEDDARRAVKGSRPITVPDGCKQIELTASELEQLQADDVEAEPNDRKLVGVKPVLAVDKRGGRLRDSKIEQYICVVKKVIVAAALLFGLSQTAFAAPAMDDIANLCDFANTAGFVVDASGDLTPCAADSMDVGASGNEIDNLYANGNLTFKTNLLAEGRYGSSVLTMQSSSTPVGTTQLAYATILKRVGGSGGLDETDGGTRLDNGTPGQVITFFDIYQEASGSWIITPDTATGFTAITLDADGEYATLLYVDDTVGWVIRATNATVTTTN